jgi:hypothetical protein
MLFQNPLFPFQPPVQFLQGNQKPIDITLEQHEVRVLNIPLRYGVAPLQPDRSWPIGK